MTLLETILAFFRSVFGSLTSNTYTLSSATASCPPVKWVRVKGGIMHMGSDSHRAWQKAKLNNGDTWSHVFAHVSGNEGSSSAYQNYDNQKATVGAGFGAKGMLGSVARNLNMPSIIPLTDNGNKYSDATIDRLASEEYAQSFVCAAESVLLRDKILAAQVKTFADSKVKYGFNTSNFPLLYLLCHLSHWYPGCVPEGGWTGQDSIDVPRALSSFRDTCKNKYNITPSEKQIANYVDTYRKIGGSYAG